MLRATLMPRLPDAAMLLLLPRLCCLPPCLMPPLPFAAADAAILVFFFFFFEHAYALRALRLPSRHADIFRQLIIAATPAPRCCHMADADSHCRCHAALLPLHAAATAMPCCLILPLRAAMAACLFSRAFSYTPPRFAIFDAAMPPLRC